MRAISCRRATMVLLTVMIAALALASPAAAARAGVSRDGTCDAGEFCYFYNSNTSGSVSDFGGSLRSLKNYGATQPGCYEFKGAGRGKGRCIKNDAASVWNRTGSTVVVYYNSNHRGPSQAFESGARKNLNATLKNENASHRLVSGSPGAPGSGSLPACALSGAYQAIYDLFYTSSCAVPAEVLAPDPGSADHPSFAGQRPHTVQHIGPNWENSIGLVWDGCSVPWQAVLIPGMGSVSKPFGFDFTRACQVHDLGYRLMDRYILPESAEEALDHYFTASLRGICESEYSDRYSGCMQVALAYATAVRSANHEP